MLKQSSENELYAKMEQKMHTGRGETPGCVVSVLNDSPSVCVDLFLALWTISNRYIIYLLITIRVREQERTYD